MRAKIIVSILLCLLPCVARGYSPPPPPPPGRGVQGEDLPAIIRQLRTNISDLKNEVRNHETEIRMFEERMHNQENSNEEMRRHLSDDFQSQKDFSRAAMVNLQSKFDGLTGRLVSVEKQIESLTQAFSRLTDDIRKNVTQTNDGISVLSDQKQKINELDIRTNAQNQHIADLEATLQTVMELIQPKEAPVPSTRSDEIKTYRVQPGDNLEKIAKLHHITVRQLKEFNRLTNDRINVGQSLKIPNAQ